MAQMYGQVVARKGAKRQQVYKRGELDVPSAFHGFTAYVSRRMQQTLVRYDRKHSDLDASY